MDFAYVASTTAIERLATTAAAAIVDRLAMIDGIATATNAKVHANLAAMMDLTAVAVCYFELLAFDFAFLNFEMA